MGQLNTPYYQQWIVDAIEKEKMKKNHLQAVITHLESEVAGLSKETVEQMKVNMKEVGVCVYHIAGKYLRVKTLAVFTVVLPPSVEVFV